MRTSVLSNFKNMVLVFAAGCFLGFPASSAFSQTTEAWTVTPYGAIASGYVFQEVGITATPDPVFQGGVTFSKGLWSFDVWNSSGLQQNEGAYGNRTTNPFKDEVDFTVNRTSHFDAPIVGSVDATYSLAYFVLADFAKTRDDVVVAYAKFDRPIKVGAVTVTPGVKFSRWVGTADVPSISLVGISGALSAPLTDKISADATLVRSVNLTDDYATNYLNLSLSRPVGTKVNMSLTAKFTENCPAVFLVGLSLRH